MNTVIGRRYPVEKYVLEVSRIDRPQVIEPYDRAEKKYGPPAVVVPAIGHVVKKDGEAGLVKERLHLPFADLTGDDRGELAERLITEAKDLEERAARNRRHAEWLMNRQPHLFLAEWKDERRAHLDRLDAAIDARRAR